MKNYTEIMEDLKETEESVKNIEKEINDIVEMKHELIKKYGFKNYKEMLDGDNIIKKINDLECCKKQKNIEIKILENNLKIAIANYVLPIFLETWNKYEGKRHGEKTADKIRKETKEKIGFYVYFQKSYGYETLSINNCKEINFDLEVKQNKKMLVDNVIQKMCENDFFMYGGDYVEDVKEKAIEIIKAFEEAEEKRKELEEACKKFNNLKVGNIDNLSIFNFRSYII